MEYMGYSEDDVFIIMNRYPSMAPCPDGEVSFYLLDMVPFFVVS